MKISNQTEKETRKKAATQIGIKCRQDIYDDFVKALKISGHSKTVAIERALQWYNAQYLDDKTAKKK